MHSSIRESLENFSLVTDIGCCRDKNENESPFCFHFALKCRSEVQTLTTERNKIFLKEIMESSKTCIIYQQSNNSFVSEMTLFSSIYTLFIFFAEQFNLRIIC